MDGTRRELSNGGDRIVLLVVVRASIKNDTIDMSANDPPVHRARPSRLTNTGGHQAFSCDQKVKFRVSLN